MQALPPRPLLGQRSLIFVFGMNGKRKLCPPAQSATTKRPPRPRQVKHKPAATPAAPGPWSTCGQRRASQRQGYSPSEGRLGRLPLSLKKWPWPAPQPVPRFTRPRTRGGSRMAQFEPCRGLPVASRVENQKSGRPCAKLRIFSCSRVDRKQRQDAPYSYRGRAAPPHGSRIPRTTAQRPPAAAHWQTESDNRRRPGLRFVSRASRDIAVDLGPAPSMCDSKCGPCDTRLGTTRNSIKHRAQQPGPRPVCATPAARQPAQLYHRCPVIPPGNRNRRTT